MAPLLTALVPHLLLPAVLFLLGYAGAPAFTAFTGGLLLLVFAAQLVIGRGRLPVLCIGGFAALGAVATTVLVNLLGLAPGVALALLPLLGLLLGVGLWFLIAGCADTTIAAVTLSLTLLAAGLVWFVTPAGLAGGSLTLEWPLDADWLLPAVVLGLLLLVCRQLTASPLARFHEAATLAGFPADRVGLDSARFQAALCLAAAALATTGGAVMTMTATPLMGPAPADWAILSLALYVTGRLGGARLGGALLAALPLVLLPKFAQVLAPLLIDLTLAVSLLAIGLQLIVRPDGTFAWRPMRDGSGLSLLRQGASWR